MSSVLDREPIAATEQERPNVVKVEDFFTRLDNDYKPSLSRLVSSAVNRSIYQSSILSFMPVSA